MHSELSASVQKGLAVFYVLCALMNGGFAWYYTKLRNRPLALLWTVVGLLFGLMGLAYFSPAGSHLIIPEWMTKLIDLVTNAVSYFVLSCIAFVALFAFRKTLTTPTVALALTNATLLAFGWSMTNSDFRSIIAKEDNVPIVMLLAAVGFFTWLSLRRAVINDDLIAEGKPPMEKDDEKVLVWPDLVYTELIAMVIGTAALIIWAILLKAPLEQPATSAKAPNPSKAPWYFLGLQEMLVYFDPWMAGVVLPTMIITGLIALPYMDYNQKGNGYYTFNERPFAILTYQFGFLVLWIVLIVLGTFLRGPNWNFYGFFEPWDPHKVVPLNNVNLSQLFWVNLLGKQPRDYPWFIRELPGILLTVGYFTVIPPLLATTVMRKMALKMGFLRYYIMIIHLLFMALLPIKMVLRWTMNLKYIIYIPEYFTNL